MISKIFLPKLQPRKPRYSSVSIEFKTEKKKYSSGGYFSISRKDEKERKKRWWRGRRQVDIAETTVTLIARKPAAEEETSLVNIEGIKATLLMEWAFKGRPTVSGHVRSPQDDQEKDRTCRGGRICGRRIPSVLNDHRFTRFRILFKI